MGNLENDLYSPPLADIGYVFRLYHITCFSYRLDQHGYITGLSIITKLTT